MNDVILSVIKDLHRHHVEDGKPSTPIATALLGQLIEAAEESNVRRDVISSLNEHISDTKAHNEMVIDEVCESRDKFKQERDEAIEFIHNLIGDVAKGATLLYLTNKMISFMED